MTRKSLSSLPEYQVWCDMKSRCYNRNHQNFPRYGARGITVCARWRGSFENFLADMGRRPSSKHSLEREKNHDNYQSDNCIWATRKQQQRNMRTNRILTFRGRSQSVAAWAEETGIVAHSLGSRLRNGWSVRRALTTPID